MEWNLDIHEALKKYQAAQLQKFIERDAKYRDSSVMRRTILDVGLDTHALHDHLQAEVAEFLTASTMADAQAEAVDVGNLAFLNWWYLEEQLLKQGQ